MNDESIFAEAVGKPPAERAAFLDAACAADAGLRGRVEALLRAHENPDPFFSAPSPHAAPTVDLPHPAERLGTAVGPYKLVEPIGEGGMGAVYLAQQQEPVRRLVALKVIKAGMDSRQVLARFEQERQALALMDHPNIAVVHDAGVTDAGDPYFVMEYVAGLPITKFADDQRLSLEERLHLFIQLCDAVQHAHQKGVIHRDLKPSNVLVGLVDGKPLVKVIDFGVAKALGARLTAETLHTQHGVVVGTPE
ncbi:MAG TPA: serine/threonine-protein kinase, partial [Gemmataceae bacterium]|nr:serine/threonine-protein kinase [Gemmataceae bacterium]